MKLRKYAYINTFDSVTSNFSPEENGTRQG